jgi:hypothetical protein
VNIPEAKKKIPVGSVHTTSAEAQSYDSEVSKRLAEFLEFREARPTRVRLGKRLLVPKGALDKMLQID